MLINWNLNKTDKSDNSKKNIKKSGASRVKSEFQSGLSEAISASSSVEIFDIDDILSEMNALEERFIENPSSPNYFELKAFIKETSTKLLRRAFKINQFRDMQKRQYEYIRVIDNNLKDLYEEVLKKTENKSKIMSIIGNIKGIILDLAA